MSDKARLRWKCRRGMKELDVLLERFLDSGYNALERDAKRAFAQLLDLEDPELYAVLMGQQPAPNDDMKHVIEFLRG